MANFDQTELLQVQNEIENIMDTIEYDDCLLGGDFNYDKRRLTTFTLSMDSFLEKVGLKSVWEKFPVDFTHIHTDMKSTSILDNFFLNESLLDKVLDAGAVHLGDNPSRHSPIMLKLNVENVLRKDLPKIRRPKRPAWYKATEENINEYTSILNDKLGEFDFPESLECRDVHCQDHKHSEDRDKLVLDILCTMIETSYECVPLSSNPKPANPKSSCPVQEKIPGWKNNIEPLRQDSLFWHSVWVSSGRPPGSLQSVMAWSRRKYHLAVKSAKRLAKSMRERDLLEAAENGDRSLMEEFRKSINKKKSAQVVPESLDGAVGHENILEQFRYVYESLHNSAGTQGGVQEIKNKLQDIIKASDSKEVEKITSSLVKEACTKMKPGKTDVSEGFTSDIFLHAPDILFDYLAGVFQSYLFHGNLTLHILSCAFMPLYKGGLKNPASSDSYRAIAGASQLLKLFEYVILFVWGHLLGSDTLQFGFKSKTSTT